jgi:hypothetical protein
MDEFDRLVAYAEVQAPLILAKDGRHTHLVMVFYGGEVTIGGLVYRDNAEREVMRQVLARRYAGRADWYIEVSEAWILPDLPLDDMLGQLRPALNPNRREVLLLSARHQDGRSRFVMWKIRRSGESVSAGDLEIRAAAVLWLDEPLLGLKTESILRYDKEGRIDLKETDHGENAKR